MDLQIYDNKEYPTYEEGDECPECDGGILTLRHEKKFGSTDFVGCSNYPRCEFTFNLDL